MSIFNFDLDLISSLDTIKIAIKNNNPMTLVGTNIHRNNKRAELLLKRTDLCLQYYFQTYRLAITSVFRSNSPYIFLQPHLIFNERNGLMLRHPTEYLQSTTNGPL